jgi:hypothetical protein
MDVGYSDICFFMVKKLQSNGTHTCFDGCEIKTWIFAFGATMMAYSGDTW